MRRGVVSGTPIQAMAISVPLGVVCFLPIALLTGELVRLLAIPAKAAVAWMAGLGVLHFVIGRYCNFKANQVAGINLTAPVVQLQVVVTMVLAVLVLHEPCTALQMIGGVVILGGSLDHAAAAGANRRGAASRRKPAAAAVHPALSRRLHLRLARRRRLWHDADHGALRAGAHRPDDRHPRRADLLYRGDRGGGACAFLVARFGAMSSR